MSYEQIVAAAPSHNTTVYLGNLHPMTTQQDIVALFSNISFVREVRLQAERGYGFAVLDSHDAAATAIFQLGNLGGGSGVQLHGRVLRVSWGKDRNDGSIVPQLPGGGLAAGLAAPNVAGLAAGMTALPNVFGGIMYQAAPGSAAGLNYHTGFALPTSAASFGLQQTGHGAHNGGQVSGLAGINNGALGHLPSFAGMNVGNGPANSGTTNSNNNNGTPGAFGNQQRSFYSAAAPAFNNGSGGAGAPAPGGAVNGGNNYLSNAFNAAPVSNAIKHH
jgi:RNA recognition motif-containing protein